MKKISEIEFFTQIQVILSTKVLLFFREAYPICEYRSEILKFDYKYIYRFRMCLYTEFDDGCSHTECKIVQTVRDLNIKNFKKLGISS